VHTVIGIGTTTTLTTTIIVTAGGVMAIATVARVAGISQSRFRRMDERSRAKYRTFSGDWSLWLQLGGRGGW
jgi:hypothetical protein